MLRFASTDPPSINPDDASFLARVHRPTMHDPRAVTHHCACTVHIYEYEYIQITVSWKFQSALHRINSHKPFSHKSRYENAEDTCWVYHYIEWVHFEYIGICSLICTFNLMNARTDAHVYFFRWSIWAIYTQLGVGRKIQGLEAFVIALRLAV